MVVWYKNGSVDLGHHTRGHTRYALGTPTRHTLHTAPHTPHHKETPRHIIVRSRCSLWGARPRDIPAYVGRQHGAAAGAHATAMPVVTIDDLV